MKAILSVDLNWGIGKEGKLLQRVPEDMKFFVQKTVGKVVVMGRGTFESLPGQQPLKDRVNIVLSKSGQFDCEGLIVCRSMEELFQKLGSYASGDIFVIGGESVYTQLLPYCSEAYVTRFEKEFDADRHFPNLDRLENWMLVSKSDQSNYKGMNFRYLKYVNVKTQPIPK
jgi:dihydrofolate reductase